MKQEEMVDKICCGYKSDYIEVLECLYDTLEDAIWMLKNSDQYDENEIYNKLENLRCYCRCIDSDSRGTGTLMKQIGV